MRREYRLYPLFEPPKMRACPSHHPVTVSSLSWLTTHRPFLKGCSTAVRAAGEVFASPGRLPDATSYRAVAAGASAGAQKVCYSRQDSNSCLIRPLPCAAHALCGPISWRQVPLRPSRSAPAAAARPCAPPAPLASPLPPPRAPPATGGPPPRLSKSCAAACGGRMGLPGADAGHERLRVAPRWLPLAQCRPGGHTGPRHSRPRPGRRMCTTLVSH